MPPRGGPLPPLTSARHRCSWSAQPPVSAERPRRPMRPRSHSGNQRPQPRMRGEVPTNISVQIKTINCIAVHVANVIRYIHNAIPSCVKVSKLKQHPSLQRLSSLKLTEWMATFCRASGVNERHSCGQQRTRYLSLGGQLGKARLIY